MVLTQKQKDEVQKIGEKYGLKLILIHGSSALGREKTGSDLDIAILGKKHINIRALLNIFGDLENVFGNTKERELDVKSIENVDALFLYKVMKDSVLIYGSSSDYWQLRTFAIRNYWDHRQIFKLEETLLKKYLYA